jgi:phenylacetate-CoA ligase
VNARLGSALLLQRLLGSRVGEKYTEFLCFERLDRQAYVAQCAERMDRTLSRAIGEIPFYRDRLRPGSALDDFPILTKRAVNEHFDALLRPALRVQGRSSRWRYGNKRVQTGGTTGTPTTVIHDADFRDAGRASRLYSQALCGFPFGTPYLLLWGSMRDINQARDSVSARALASLSGHRLLNAFQMNEEQIAKYLSLFHSERYHFAMGYVDALEALAQASRQSGRGGAAMRRIMACAGAVTSEAKEEIRAAFGATVHNKYGSRECTDMACECEFGALHVYSHHVHLEIVDDAGHAVPSGESGRILVTLLGNRTFPIIRYDIGDVGRATNADCECGRPFPLIGAVEGRTQEMLTTTSGAYVTPVYIRHLIGVVHNPNRLWRRFQVVQRSAISYEVFLERDPRANQEAVREMLSRVRQDLRAVFGANAQIALTVVDSIPNADSGKFLYVRNEYRRSGEKSA